MKSPRKIFLLLLAPVLMFAYSISQTWLFVSYADGLNSGDLALSGAQLNSLLTPLLLAIGLSCLLLFFATALAARLLALIVAAAAITAGVSCVFTAQQKSAAALAALAAKTGVTGGGQLELITASENTVWSWVSVFCAASVTVLSLVVFWRPPLKKSGVSRFERPGVGRAAAAQKQATTAKFGSQPAENLDAPADNDRISDWDALTKNEDPT